VFWPIRRSGQSDGPINSAGALCAHTAAWAMAPPPAHRNTVEAVTAGQGPFISYGGLARKLTLSKQVDLETRPFLGHSVADQLATIA
jgi:hypothetical protein